MIAFFNCENTCKYVWFPSRKVHWLSELIAGNKKRLKGYSFLQRSNSKEQKIPEICVDKGGVPKNGKERKLRKCK